MKVLSGQQGLLKGIVGNGVHHILCHCHCCVKGHRIVKKKVLKVSVKEQHEGRNILNKA